MGTRLSSCPCGACSRGLSEPKVMKRVLSSSLLLAIPLLLLLAFSAAAGQAQQSPRKASKPLQVNVDVARALAITRGGKPLVAGVSRKGSRRAWALARYRANGSLDPSFGAGGRVLTLIQPGQIEPYGPLAVAIQADGKVVVAGGGGFRLARYTVRGRLDPSFAGTAVC